MSTSGGRAALLTNPRSERVKGVVSLRRGSVRARRARFLVEGPHAVRELLRYARSHVVDLYLTEQAWGENPDLPQHAHEEGAGVYECTDHVLTVMADAQHPQGVLAVASPIDVTPRAALDAVGAGFAVILSNVRDPGNAGTVIRGADAFGAAAVLVSSDSVDLYNPKLIRSTVGSAFHLPISAGAPIEQILATARRCGIALLAADGAGPTRLRDAGLASPHAWVLGNEARGLPEDVVAGCDDRVAVPIVGHAESLNLAMAATVCMHASAAAREAV
ncbi:MAG: RNA methyltransferase [Ornithinimicrobium sp.]